MFITAGLFALWECLLKKIKKSNGCWFRLRTGIIIYWLLFNVLIINDSLKSYVRERKLLCEAGAGDRKAGCL
jgi:hypothetical protein